MLAETMYNTSLALLKMKSPLILHQKSKLRQNLNQNLYIFFIFLIKFWQTVILTSRMETLIIFSLKIKKLVTFTKNLKIWSQIRHFSWRNLKILRFASKTESLVVVLPSKLQYYKISKSDSYVKFQYLHYKNLI